MKLCICAGGRASGAKECYGSEKRWSRMKSYCQVQERYVQKLLHDTCPPAMTAFLEYFMWGSVGYGC